MKWPLICCGSCDGSTLLGHIDLPDTTTPADVARATFGYLCPSCGAGYRAGVANGTLRPGEIRRRKRPPVPPK